jgi:hypothetical protein
MDRIQFYKTGAIKHEVIRSIFVAFLSCSKELMHVFVLSHGSVDKKTEDCRGDLFKFKARPLDRKVAGV